MDPHFIIYTIGIGVEGRCTELFPKYLDEEYFLIGNRVYVYKEKDLTTEDLYHKKRLMSFINDLGYLGSGIPSDKAGQKRLQCLINVQSLMETCFREERKVIFGNFFRSFLLLLSLIFLLTTYLLLSWLCVDLMKN